MTSETSETRTEHELAITMAKVQDHHQKAAEALANHKVRQANYHLMQTYLALEDYLTEDGNDDGE